MRVDEPELAAEMNPVLRRVHRKLTGIITRVAKRNAPFRTGRLKASIEPDAEHVEGMRATGGVSANTPYAIYLEKGTRPHIIRPTGDKKALAFDWERGGGRRLFRSVHHPGTRPRPFMMRSAEEGAAMDDDIQHD